MNKLLVQTLVHGSPAFVKQIVSKYGTLEKPYGEEEKIKLRWGFVYIKTSIFASHKAIVTNNFPVYVFDYHLYKELVHMLKAQETPTCTDL